MDHDEPETSVATKYLLIAVSWLLRAFFALGALSGINALMTRDEISFELFVGFGTLAGLPWSLVVRIFPHSDGGTTLSAITVWAAALYNYRWIRQKLLRR